MIDPVTKSYNRQCLDGNERLLAAMAAVRFPEAFSATYGQRLLPRPFFIDEAAIRGCVDDLVALFHLLASLPERLFDGDDAIRQYCEQLGIDARRAAMIWRFPGPPSLYGRADLYHDGESFKLLEYNIDSGLGGTDRAEIPRALMEVEAFREFADEHRLGYVHTGERIARMLRDAGAPVTDGADPVVAMVEEDGGLSKYRNLAVSFQEMMGSLGIQVLLGEVSQVHSRAGELYLHGQRIDVVLRYFLDEEIISTSNETAVEPIFLAHESGKAVLWTTMRSLQVFNKGCLALLSDARWRDRYTTAERALVDRLLPWTRTVTRGPTEVNGESVDLVDYCRAQREELILKTRTGYGGDRILVGWEVSDREWAGALAAAMGRDYVVQRRVVPRSEPVVDPVTGRMEHWVAVWDAFLTPEGYAGSHIRACPSGGGAVINMGASRARTTGVFYYPAEEA